MSKKKRAQILDEDPELNIPVKFHINKPKKSSAKIGPHSSVLYDSSSFNYECSIYGKKLDEIPSTNRSNVSENPPLFAVNRRFCSSLKPNLIKPAVGSHRSASVGIESFSLLNKKTLPSLHSPVKTIITPVEIQNNIERLGLMFKDDLVSYFSKHRDGQDGHKFIYLKYAKSRKDPYFSPYDLVKVPFCDAGDDYFIISATGVTHVDEFGNTDHCSIDSWVDESFKFNSICKLKVFREFMFWKPFKLWKTFVMQQRYKKFLCVVKDRPLYSNISFMVSTIQNSTLTQSLSKIVTDFILVLVPFRKYKLSEFHDLNQTNLENLQQNYKSLLEEIISNFEKLHDDIANPKHLEVQDSDFDEIKRIHPNMAALITLEQKKEEQRLKQGDLMKKELKYILDHARLVDYMLLEEIQESCFEAWKISMENISQQTSSIFTVELSFDPNGQVLFLPDKDTLLDTINNFVDSSTLTLENLPRILFSYQIRKMVNISHDPDFPTLKEMFDNSGILNDIKKSIKDGLDISYEEAEKSSFKYCDYYPLFKLGKDWNVRKYLKTPRGSMYEGHLNINDRDPNEKIDDFLFYHDDEPSLDFNLLRNDLKHLRIEEERVLNVRIGYISRMLFVDMRPLKKILLPIPKNSLSEIEKTLNLLLKYKIDLITRVIKYYEDCFLLPIDSLQNYVDFCSNVKKIQNFVPLMNSEMEFIDNIVLILNEFNFQAEKNPLYDSYGRFKAELNAALTLKNNHSAEYLLQLKILLENQFRKLEKYLNQSKMLPKSLKTFDLNKFSNDTTSLKNKLKKVKSLIEKCINYQTVLEREKSSLDKYQEAIENIKLSEYLISLYTIFTEVNFQVRDVPFIQVNIESFQQKCEQISQEISKFDEMLKGRPCSVFREISDAFMEFSMFSEELHLLKSSYMKESHWIQLFDEAGHSGKYNENITIIDLINMKILEQFNVIKKITTISLGEYKLEKEFNEIQEYLSTVHLPLVDAKAKDEMTLLLSPIDNLISKATSSSITLHQLLDNQYIKGIQEEVEALAKAMDKIIIILKEWQIFQSNWTVVSTMFQQSAIAAKIPRQQQRYLSVRKKWSAIAHHVLSNTRLIAVCSFPTLYEDLHDCSIDLEIILKDLILFTNKKRDLVPRLYFLSDSELLTLLSTRNFDEFTLHFTKMLMYITKLEGHFKETNDQDPTQEMCNFNGFTLFTVLGEDGDSLSLKNKILCSGPFETWAPNIFESIKESFKISFKDSLERFKKQSLPDFIMTTSAYIGTLVYLVYYSMYIEDCFSKLETNPRVFLHFEQQLKEKQNEIINTLSSPLNPIEMHKLSNILIFLNMSIERVQSFQDKIHGYSHQLSWHNTLKHKYDPNTDSLVCEIGDYSINHGLEYWGNVPAYVITPELDSVIINIGNSLSHDQIPLIYGPYATGKTSISRYFSMMFGHFFYNVQPFPDITKSLLNQILIGVFETGSWANFRNIHEMRNEIIEYLFDKVRAIYSSQVSKKETYEFDDNTSIRLDKTSKIFMSRIVESEIPSQLRSFTRPISLSIPSLSKLIEIQMMSIGFKSSKLIAPKLLHFLRTATGILKLPNSYLTSSVKILRSAFEVLLEMIHSSRCGFINYYEESRTAEEYSIARSCFTNLNGMLDDEQVEVFLQMLYAHFTLFSDFGNFKSYIQKPNCFSYDTLESIMEAYLYKRIPELNIDVPIDYLIAKTLNLFRLMKNNTIIVINGPPSSGKSLIIQLLTECFQLLSDTPDVAQMHISGIKPLKVARCFHGSGSWNDIFGSDKYDSQLKQQWIIGEIHSALTYLNRFKETHHPLLHLDGHIDSKLAEYFVTISNDTTKLSFTSRSTFTTSTPYENFSNNCSMHIIIETDNLPSFLPTTSLFNTHMNLDYRNDEPQTQSDPTNVYYDDIPPYFSALIGVLSMNSCQYFVSPLQVTAELDLMHPSIPFSIASKGFKGLLDESTISLVRSLFCEFAPEVIRQVHLMHLKIDIFYACSNFAIYAAQIALSEVYENNKNLKISKSNDSPQSHDQEINEKVEEELNETEICKYAVLFSLYRVFSAIMAANQISTFDEYIRSAFKLKIPEEWVGYGVPNEYWDVFPTPSILSMCISNGKLNPHNTSGLDQTFLTNENSLVVLAPQFLPNLTTFQLGLKSMHNFLIFGDRYTGKESFVQICLQKNPYLIPVHFHLTPYSTARHLRTIILKQSKLAAYETKRPSDPTMFVLIFHRLDGCKIEIFEFIRMLITTKTLPLLSDIDVKAYEELKLNKFFVIATGMNITNFPPRFVSHFTPLYMPTYLSRSKEFIITKYMQKEFMDSKFISIINYIFRDLQTWSDQKRDIELRKNSRNNSPRYLKSSDERITRPEELNLNVEKMLQIVRVICMMPGHTTRNDYVKQLNVFMSEIQFALFTEDPIGFEEFQQKIQKVCQGLNLDHIYQQYIKERKVFLPRIGKKLSLVEVDIQQIKESLSKLAGRKLTELEAKQYILVEHCISRAKSHCEIYGPTSTGKMSLVRLCSKKLGIPMIDMTTSSIEKLKHALVLIIYTKKQQLIVLRVSTSTQEKVYLLYTLFVFKHYMQLFSADEIEELYKNISKTDHPTETQQRDAHNQITSTIENLCHLVLITETLIDLPLFEIITIKRDTNENICNEILRQDKDYSEMSNLFCNLLDKLEKYLPFSHQNQFYDLLENYEKILNREKSTLINRNNKIKLALQFYKKLKREQSQMQESINKLLPSVSNLKEQASMMQDKYHKSNQMIDKTKNKLNEELMYKMAELNQKKKDLKAAQDKLNVKKPKFEALKQKILDFEEDDIQSLKMIAINPTNTINIISEIICTLSNRYKDNRILLHDSFISVLTEEIDYRLIGSEQFTKLKNLFDKNIDIDNDQIDSTPSLSIIYHYLKKVYKMIGLNNTLVSKKNTVKQCQESLDEYNAKMEKELNSLQQIESNVKHQSQDLYEKQQILQDAKKEYKEIRLEKKYVDSILKDLENLIAIWKEESDTFENLSKCLKGDTIIWIMYLVYAGILPANQRIKFMEKVSDILANENIQVSSNNPIDYIENRLVSMKLPITTEFSLPKPLLVDMQHILNSIRVPLIVDIDGIILHYLKSSSNVVHVSLNSMSFEKVVARCFQSNTFLAVTDVDRLIPIISQIMSGDEVLKFGNKEINRHPQFKLFLFTNKTKIDDFSPDLLSRVTVIDTTCSSLDGVKSSIIHKFVSFFDSDLMPRVMQAEKSEASHQEVIKSYEVTSLDTFVLIAEKDKKDKNYLFSTDEETVDSFCTAKDCYIAYTINSDQYDITRELEVAINQYLPLIDTCHYFWIVITRYVRKMSPSVVTLNQILKTITNVFENAGLHTLTPEKIQEIQHSLIISFYQLIFPSLGFDETLIFVFLFGYFIHGFEGIELEQILDHIVTEYDNNASFDTLSNVGNSNLRSFKKIESFTSAVSKNLIDMLKFASIDHVFQLIYNFACETMSKEFLNYLPFFSVDNAFSGPLTILYSDIHNDPTELIYRFVSNRNLNDSFIMISLNKYNVDETRKSIMQAIEKGLWIVINYSNPSLEAGQLCNEIPSLIFSNQDSARKSKDHENFRLILNCRTTEYFSHELLEVSKFLRVESFPSIKETMQELYFHHSVSLKIIDKSHVGKKVLYLTALLFAQIQYRAFLSPCGFNNILPLSIWSFHYAIEAVRHFIELPDFPIRNYREYLENAVLSSAVIDSEDVLRIKSMSSSLVTQEALDDNFNIGSIYNYDPSLSNHLGHENDRWLLHGDPSIGGFIQFISKLPLVTNSEILGMDNNTAGKLLEWDLSRYISSSIVRIKKKSLDLEAYYQNLDFEVGNNNVNIFGDTVMEKEKQFENMRQYIKQQIPPKIESVATTFEITPLLQFWIIEANELNDFLESMKEDLEKKRIRIKENIVPDKWQKYKSLQKMNQFIAFLKEKREFISKYVHDKNAEIKEIDITMISNIKAFFNAYLANYAYKKQIAVNTLFYDFSFGQGNEHHSLLITNLIMMNGSIENGSLVPSTKPFTVLPTLYCKLRKKNASLISRLNALKTYNCPLYKFVFDKKVTSSDNFIMNNDESNNFVMEIPIPNEFPDKMWILNGTSIYCNLPSQFIQK